MQGNYLKQVKDQYEDYPYPFRDPKDEKTRLVNTALDGLSYLNHCIYGGKQGFRNGYTVLVAGGGTGDSTIYLAEQLRDMDGARVIYVDLSQASMDIAKQRAKVRELENIEWHLMSLLDIADLNISFDYINCSGVLHHLADPVAGIKALASVLKPDGALGLMVYAEYGRTSVYQMQDLLGLIHTPEMSAAEKVAMTKKVLTCLPPTNLFRAQEAIWGEELRRNGDIGIYDLLLHSTDRAYTVPQLYDWVGEVGMTIPRFAGSLGYGLCYRPEFVFGRDAVVMEAIKGLSLPDKEAVAELAHANISRHIFYATKATDIAADVGDDDMVPFFFMECLSGPDIAQQADAADGAPVAVQVGGGVRITLPQSLYLGDILRHLDGHNTIGDIVAKVAEKHKGVDKAAIRVEFEKVYAQLEMVDALLLRHKDVPAFTPVLDMQRRVA